MSDSKPVLIPLNTVDAKSIQWLWLNRIPQGMLTLCIGDAGLGKSFLSLYLASTISKGSPWPDANGLQDNAAPLGSTILLTAEDDLPHVVRPRLDKMNADPSRIFALEAVQSDKDQQFFNLQRDLPALRDAIRSRRDTQLVIIDPLSAYLGGKVDSHRDADVRRVLMPLVQLAEETAVAVIGVMHLNKNTDVTATHRAIGSVAFAACARTVWAVTPDPENDRNGRRLFLPVKNNVLVRPTGLAFKINDGRVLFEDGTVDTTADEALGHSRVEAPKLNQAIEFIKERLPVGTSLYTKELSDLAEKAGIKDWALREAKNRLSVVKYPLTVNGTQRWFVRLPDDLPDETPSKEDKQQYSSIDNNAQVGF
jgi:archaellum biogenesis ATPase FlaH